MTVVVDCTTSGELRQLIDSFSDVDDAFPLRQITHIEVLNVLKYLRSDCSTGPDQLPARFVKLVADHLAGPLSTIINNCITKSYFPRAWKIARISPILKVDTPVREDHLRPVSILPVLSNGYEKLVAAQMVHYCGQQGLLRDTVSSFRKGHSTTSVLLGIRDDLLKAMKKKVELCT